MSERRRYATASEMAGESDDRGVAIYQLHNLLEIARQLGTDAQFAAAHARIVGLINKMTSELHPDAPASAPDDEPEDGE